MDRLLHHPDGRGGVRGAGDREVGPRDARGPFLVVAEGRQEGLARVGHEPHRGLDAGVADRFPAGPSQARGELRAQEVRDRLAAHARPEAADAFRVDARGEAGVREQHVDQGLQRHRAHQLHLDELVEVGEEVGEVAQVLEADAGEPRVAVEDRAHHEAVRGELHHRVDVARADGAAAQAVGEHDERQAGGPGRPRGRRQMPNPAAYSAAPISLGCAPGGCMCGTTSPDPGRG